MRVMIPVFFRAPMGGLQEHVRSQALGLQERGFEPLVACRPGPFSKSLEEDNVAVFRTEFRDAIADAAYLADEFVPGLVHIHPFASRLLGIQVAELVKCPVISTFHGRYTDDIGDWSDRVVQIVAVTEGIRHFLLDQSPELRDKIVVIPNGVDTERFRARQQISDTDGLEVLVASRFDESSSLLVGMLTDTWSRQIRDREFRIRWQMAGGGTRIHELQAVGDRLNSKSGQPVVTWHGWLDGDSLASLNRRVDLAVSPGRSALESMACGVPTIAVSAFAYYGPTWRTGSLGMSWNWGHRNAVGYEPGSLYSDLADVLRLPVVQRDRVGRASRQFVEAFHAQSRVDDALAAMYELLLTTTGE